MLRRRMLPALLALASLASQLPAQPTTPAAAPPAPVTAESLVPDWRIGSVADRDLFAPTELLVRDPDGEAQLRMRAADSVSSIFRFEPANADAAIAALERGFAESRAAFQKDLTDKFGALPLNSAQYTSDAFRAFRKEWSDAATGFPPKFAIAKAWALGQSGEEHLGPYREKLARTLRDTYLGEELPAPDANVGPAEVRLVTADGSGTPITAAQVATSATTIRRAQISSLALARDTMRDSMVREDWPAARFLGRLLKPNTFFEAALTRAEREARARDSAPPPERIIAGRAIIRSGETITPRHHAALRELKRVVAADPVAGAQFIAQIRGEPAPEPESKSAPAPWMNNTVVLALAVALGALALAVLVALVLLFRRQRKPAPGTALDVPNQDGRRAVVATALRDEAVQRLYSQRQDLLAGQHASSAEVESLEQRINRLQPQLQERLRTYAARIAHLEGELARVRGGDATRVRDALDLARQERDAELARAGVAR